MREYRFQPYYTKWWRKRKMWLQIAREPVKLFVFILISFLTEKLIEAKIQYIAFSVGVKMIY